MNPVRQELLRARGFEVEQIALAKKDRIASWFADNQLDSAVLGVSGGIDSAVVLALLMRAKLRRVVAVLLPFHDSVGATRQSEATRLGRLVATTLGAEYWDAPMGAALQETLNSLSAASKLPFDAWSIGQTLSVARTPALYGAAALLQAHAYKSVVVGTTNRDEGAYLGFFGKASDAMVDVQPISDLHKSEVRALARYLNIPQEVIDAAASGDVFDGRTDEQMIGASYDDVELYLRLRESRRDPSAFMSVNVVAAIDRLHAHNRHKYLTDGAAIHLDVMPRGVQGGWRETSFVVDHREQAPLPDSIPGAWTPAEAEIITEFESCAKRMTTSTDLSLSPIHESRGALVRVVDDVLTHAECDCLIQAMLQSGKATPVGVTGIAAMSSGIGSTRATAWAPLLANALFDRLCPSMPSIRVVTDTGFTDCFATEQRAQHNRWRLLGLTPLLRFMRYERGGQHYGHYDAAYDYGDGRRTLMSVVFYLSDSRASGATRFLKDRNGQEALLSSQRDFSDWDREAHDDEILARVLPTRGRVVVFDHCLCHDVERWVEDGERFIIRADLVFEAIPPSAWRQ